MRETFLSLFFNMVTSSLKFSRGGILRLGEKLNGYYIAEHIATKIEINTWMLSTSKNAKYI